MAKKRKAVKRRALPRELLGGELVPAFGDEVFLVRRRASSSTRPKKKSSDRAGTLLLKAGSELREPGIKRKAVFKSKTATIFAYSVDPRDPQRIFRQGREGKRTVGRYVGGRFKAL
jgi:hypothetical protein